MSIRYILLRTLFRAHPIYVSIPCDSTLTLTIRGLVFPLFSAQQPLFRITLSNEANLWSLDMPPLLLRPARHWNILERSNFFTTSNSSPFNVTLQRLIILFPTFTFSFLLSRASSNSDTGLFSFSVGHITKGEAGCLIFTDVFIPQVLSAWSLPTIFPLCSFTFLSRDDKQSCDHNTPLS